MYLQFIVIVRCFLIGNACIHFVATASIAGLKELMIYLYSVFWAAVRASLRASQAFIAALTSAAL